MKNQGDIIALIVAFVVLVGGSLAFYFTKPEPTKPAPPSAVNETKLELPSASVVMSNGLGGSGTGAAAGRTAGGPATPGVPGGPAGRTGGPAGGTSIANQPSGAGKGTAPMRGTTSVR